MKVAPKNNTSSRICTQEYSRIKVVKWLSENPVVSVTQNQDNLVRSFDDSISVSQGIKFAFTFC